MMAVLQVWTEKRLLKRRKQYRWRIKAGNGRIIATGSEGYYNLADLMNAVTLVQAALVEYEGRAIPIHDGRP